MITPIHRIPQINDGHSLIETILAEMTESPSDTHESLIGLSDHCSEESHLECTMDWAMQIRAEYGIPWGECIRIASILYFG